jgi:signal transduction histidine kinase/DNA-binding NarL/FixJ family response regulator
MRETDSPRGAPPSLDGVDALDQRSTKALGAVAEDLAGEFALRPLLERILQRSTELLGTDAGSICLVDEAKGVYTKEADIGVGCQSGKAFPLTEGVTGAVVANRAPVIFEDYLQVPGGHVSPEDRASLRGVIGVPIWWAGEIIGSCVVFSRDPDRVFEQTDAELLRLFASHAAIAIENARLHAYAEANARNEAVAEERTRMAREVHDTVAQGLVSILMELREADAALREQRYRDVERTVEQARLAAESAFEDTRRSVLGLAPALLEGASLEDALRAEIAWANETGAAEARLSTAGVELALPQEHVRTLFRIAQEALTNALRHAEARSVRVGLIYAPAEVTLLIQDDGTGFDRASMNRRPQDGTKLHGVGLDGMAERARILGGDLEIESMPGWGTRVRASIPLGPLGGGDGEPTRPIEVLVVDDHPLTRAGMRHMVGGVDGIHVVGEASSGDEALERWRRLKPTVTLMDLRMEAGDGLDAIAWITAEDPTATIIGITAFVTDELVRAASRAGAWTVLGKESAREVLVDAVVAAARGEEPPHSPSTRGARAPDALTARERQVLRLLERGSTDREIAAALGISVKTVEKHVSAILRKSGATNRTQAAALSREREAD